MDERTAHPELSKNLVLIGGRGCGKSSIAKRLARANRRFMLLSLDALVRYEAGGVTIPAIVAREGWKGFRKREWEVVQKVAAFEGEALIDTGGGVVVELDADGNEHFGKAKVTALRRHGIVVYLSRPIEELEAKISSDPDRPALSTSDSFRKVMKRREPWYRKAAHRIVDCGDRTKNDLADDILAWFYEEIGADEHD
jgi:shikimate kinase